MTPLLKDFQSLLTGDALAEKIIEEISQLTVTAGALRGQPFKVLEWEREFIYGMVHRSISLLTIGRGNGKTSLIAAIATTALIPGGALWRPRGKGLIVASSVDQGKEAFDHIRFFLEDRMDADRIDARREGLKNPWRVVDNTHEGRIGHTPTGSEIRVLGSVPKKAHGKAPALMILDEPAQWDGADGGRKMYNAMKTSRGKEEDARMMILGTRPENLDHWYAELLANPKGAFVQMWAAEKGDDDFALATILKANPSYHHNPVLQKAIAEDMADAIDGGPELAVFRAHRLNMGTPETNKYEMLIPIENWEAITNVNAKPRGGPLFIGFDLGGGLSMTAIAFYWAETGRLEAYAALPALPSLAEKGKDDAVGGRYVKMYERGELTVYPGWATNNVKFLTDSMERVKGYEILGFAADNYKQLDLKQALYGSGLGEHYEATLRRVGRGQDGGEDVRAFQNEVLEAHISVEPNLLMESAIAEAVIHRDSNGNAALFKARNKGRIDAMQAVILAAGLGRRWRVPSEKKKPFSVGKYLITQAEIMEADKGNVAVHP